MGSILKLKLSHTMFSFFQEFAHEEMPKDTNQPDRDSEKCPIHLLSIKLKEIFFVGKIS